MRPAENINDLIKKLKLKASTDLDKRVHDDISKALAESDMAGSAVKQPNIWSTIMKSPITKIATAAVIIIACVIGLSLWKNTGSGIALADVLTRIEQVTGYAYQLSSTTTKQQLTGSRTSHILVSKEHGIKVTITKADPNSAQMLPRYYAEGTEWYVLPEPNSLVFINHKEKTYDRTIFADGFELNFYKREYYEPRTIIKQLLSCEHRSLGQSVIDGITVEGFQTTDLAYGGGFFGEADWQGELEKVDVKLWVDVDTFLPVRVETNIVTKKEGMQIREVSYDFRWNIVINPNDFESSKPSDYHSDTPEDVVIRGGSEENTIKALRLFADAIGSYPASLETKMFMAELKERITLDPNVYEGNSREDKTRKSLNEWLLMTNPTLFYEPLVEDKKDPVYYGKTVTPKDTDKVLLRWKLSDNEYRVIFGDLSAKTVTAEELAKLEKP